MESRLLRRNIILLSLFLLLPLLLRVDESSLRVCMTASGTAASPVSDLFADSDGLGVVAGEVRALFADERFSCHSLRRSLAQLPQELK